MRTIERDSERATSVVEMAIVMPVMLAILVGIMELGFVFKDVLGASQAVREGVRIASFSGDSIGADCDVIEGIAPHLSPYADSLDRVEVYKADSAGNQIPGLTNAYTFAFGDIDDCGDWVSVVQWEPTNRRVRISDGPLDIIGVRVVLRHHWITQIPPFDGVIHIDESGIGRLEPEAF